MSPVNLHYILTTMSTISTATVIIEQLQMP